jgi:hypothetical protein
MSMNVLMYATAKATLHQTNEVIDVIHKFSTMQTSTKETERIIDSDNKLNTYIDIIKSDFLKSIDSYDYYNTHIIELNKFIEDHKDWSIVWNEI